LPQSRRCITYVMSRRDARGNDSASKRPNHGEKGMKAWRSHRTGGPETLVLEEIEAPQPADDELLVQVHAAGINFPDGLFLRDQYQITLPRPIIPGSEFSGIVVGRGPRAGDFAIGERVIGRCGWGAMAERIAVAQGKCARLPDGLPLREAAAFMFAHATAWHALRDLAGLREGETLLVLGAAGGVGCAAVQIGRALGAQVRAAVSSEARLAHAIACGAHDGLVYPPTLEQGGGKALAARFKALLPQGADVVFDPVGGDYAEAALRSLAHGGRHLVVGFTAGIPRVPLNLTLLRSARIIGVDWRTFSAREPAANAANIAALLELWRQGRIAPPVSEVFPFARAPAAIARLETREALGKLVVEVAEDDFGPGAGTAAAARDRAGATGEHAA
jgi:NADPH2:quinone reductase